VCLEDRNEKKARVVSGRWSVEAVSSASARERRHEEVARSRAKRERESFENCLRNRSKSLFAAPWPSEKHGFYCTKRTWTLKKHGFYCTDRTSDVQNRSRGSSGRSGAIRGASGVLPGRSGRRSESSRDTPGAPRDAPGRPRDPPERPKSEPGRPRIDFWERSFRTVVRETLPGRFSDVFGSLGGGPDVDSAAPCQCFVRVERFSSKRPPDHKIDRKRLENGPQIAPDRSRKSSRTPPERPGERRFAQDRRFLGKRSERRRGAAQEERYGGAVGAPDLRSTRGRVSDYT
jgi:hypothetical protein